MAVDNKIKIRHFICKNKYELLTWSGWPSGLRRCVQVAVYNCRRGFESRFYKYFRKYIIGNMAVVAFLDNKIKIRHSICKNKYELLHGQDGRVV